MATFGWIWVRKRVPSLPKRAFWKRKRILKRRAIKKDQPITNPFSSNSRLIGWLHMVGHLASNVRILAMGGGSYIRKS